MKKAVLSVLCFFGISFGLGAFSSALAWYVEMDNVNGDNVFEVWLKVQEGDTLTLRQYDISFAFDETEVAWGGVYADNLPDGFYEKYSPGQGGPGIISGLEGKGDYFKVTEDYLLCTFTMNILEGATQDGQPDIWFPAPPFDGFNNYKIMIKSSEYGLQYWSQLYNGGYLVNGAGLDVGAPVPVPGAAWLLGSGLLGVLGVRKTVSKRT